MIEHLNNLGSWLDKHRDLWSERAFVGLPLKWEHDYPEVSQALRSLTDGQIEAFDSKPWDLPGMPAAYQNWVSEARQFIEIPGFEQDHRLLPSVRPRGVTARKWDQIRSFLAVLLAENPDGIDRWFDWCSGKGHLSRTLAVATSKNMICVERDQKLCEKGFRLASQVGVRASFISADVLARDFEHELDKKTAAIALHACGALHQRLMFQAVQGECRFLAFAPCCYHRGMEETYLPMSEAGRSSLSNVTRGHLKLVGLCEVVTSNRRSELRRREQTFRLGLDLMIREHTGKDEYSMLGPCPRSWVDLSFREFCQNMIARSGLDLEPKSFKEYKEQGEKRFRLVRALGLVRGLFRRPLEVWLALDRAQFLVEKGFDVRLGKFCSHSVTPRNIMLIAQR